MMFAKDTKSLSASGPSLGSVQNASMMRLATKGRTQE